MIAPDAHGISHGLVLPRNFVRNSCFYRLAPPHELPFSEQRSAAAFGHSSVALMLLLRRSLASCWSFSMCLSGKYGTTVTRVTLLPGAFRLWYESPQRLVASPRILKKKKKNTFCGTGTDRKLALGQSLTREDSASWHKHAQLSAIATLACVPGAVCFSIPVGAKELVGGSFNIQEV